MDHLDSNASLIVSSSFKWGRTEFGGFHGSTKDGNLESIGVYVKPITTLNNPAGKVKEERSMS